MYRLPPAPGEWIDRWCVLSFEFEGRSFKGYAGDTIGSALAAAGEMTLGRSFKYHRPRGIHSFANHDANNLFQVEMPSSGSVPNVRGDVTPLVDGMRVTAVNTAGGPKRDGALSSNGWRLSAWAFITRRFTAALSRWERRSRHVLGAVVANAPRRRTPALRVLRRAGHRRGPQRPAAALSAADAGARVLLVDESARGWLRTLEWRAPPARLNRSLIESPHPASAPTSTYAAGTTRPPGAGGFHAHDQSARARGIATGVIEQPAVFATTIAGVMSGPPQLLHRHGIAPGKRIASHRESRGYERARVRARTEFRLPPCWICAPVPAATYGLGDCAVSRV